VEKQNRLVIEILKRLSAHGVLGQVLIIGSWCAGFYKAYFVKADYHPRLKTRDIDFLLPVRAVFPKPIDLEKLLAPLGFEIEFYGEGYMKLESDELALELLIPEVGPAREKPHPLPALKFNAQPLRHTAMLWRDPIEVRIEGVRVRLPHPADFCLQKLIVSGKRRKAGSAEKDRLSAFEVLDALIERGEIANLHAAYRELTKAEKKVVDRALLDAGYEGMMSR
jgi:hypothetical protein